MSLFGCVFFDKGVFPSGDAYVSGGVALYGNVFVDRGCSSPAKYRLAGVFPSPLVVGPLLRVVVPSGVESRMSFKE